MTIVVTINVYDGIEPDKLLYRRERKRDDESRKNGSVMRNYFHPGKE